MTEIEKQDVRDLLKQYKMEDIFIDIVDVGWHIDSINEKWFWYVLNQTKRQTKKGILGIGSKSITLVEELKQYPNIKLVMVSDIVYREAIHEYKNYIRFGLLLYDDWIQANAFHKYLPPQAFYDYHSAIIPQVSMLQYNFYYSFVRINQTTQISPISPINSISPISPISPSIQLDK